MLKWIYFVPFKNEQKYDLISIIKFQQYVIMLLLIIYNNTDLVTKYLLPIYKKMTDVENSSQKSFRKSSGVELFFLYLIVNVRDA